MQSALSQAFSEPLLAAMPQLSEKPHQGVPSSNPALYLGHEVCKSTTALGLRAALHLERVKSRYTGKERDTESGNDYFMARYYASSMGRFLSPDWSAKREPIPYAKLDNPQSLNLYAYVFNNPLSHIDADGHATWFDPKGKKIGTDGVNDGGVVIAQRNSVAFSPDHSIIDMAASGTPMYSFSKEEIGAMKASVARTLAPSTTGDMKGGFHEEGFTEKGGAITPAAAGPGYKPGDSEAHVNVPIGPDTTLVEHTHPSGSDATLGGTKFEPGPSAPDLRIAGSSQFLNTRDPTFVQVNAANSDAHVYDGSGVKATFNLNSAP
jgi:RHS repeat-associated protein